MASTDLINWENVEVLKAVNDDHGGVIVELKAPMDPGVFSMCLKASLLKWRNQGKKGVWIKLPIELAGLVQHIVEILVVQEKNGKSRGLGFWKIPTGVINQGEDIFAGVVREVKEETGIDTEFIEVLAFRQSHNSFFEKSDLFFLCMLHPLSFDIQKQESEIEAAQWMPIEKYAAEPLVQRHEFSRHLLAVGLAKLENTYAGFSPVCVQSKFFDGRSYIYLNARDLKQDSGPDNLFVNS